MKELAGIFPVLAMPFDDGGRVDFGSLAAEIDWVLEAGVAGIVVFGLASEVYKLTDEERREICRFTVSRVAGRVPVVAGAEHTGTEAAAERSYEAQELGADAVMLYPPSFVKPAADGVVDYYATVSQRVRIPIVVQDAQAWTGVALAPALLQAISAAAPNVRYVKVETPPTGPRMSEILAGSGKGLRVLGGYGGTCYYDEHRRGAVGTFIGAGMPDLFVRVAALLDRGDWEAGAALFHRYLPLLLFALSSLDTFNEVQKFLLYRAGVFRTTRMRRPHVPMDELQWAYLDELLRSLPLRATGREGGSP